MIIKLEFNLEKLIGSVIIFSTAEKKEWIKQTLLFIDISHPPDIFQIKYKSHTSLGTD